jgi:hypothetical protein
VVKGRYLLDRDLLARRFVDGRAGMETSQGAEIEGEDSTRAISRDLPDNTICTLADDILNVVLLTDIERDLSRTLRVRSGGGARHGGVWRMIETRKRGGGGAVVEGGVGLLDIVLVAKSRRAAAVWQRLWVSIRLVSHNRGLALCCQIRNQASDCSSSEVGSAEKPQRGESRHVPGLLACESV